MNKIIIYLTIVILLSLSVFAQQYHPAEQVRAGTFGIGDYTFNDSTVVVRAGTTSLTQPSGEWALKVEQSTDATTKYGLSVSTRWAAAENKIFEVARHWDGSQGYYPIFYVDGIGDMYWKDGNTAQNTLMFWDQDDDIILNPTDKVGIGTTNPQYKLHVYTTSGQCILGEQRTTSGTVFGVVGTATTSSAGVGVRGSGGAAGVEGTTTASGATGVYGYSQGASAIGVHGRVLSGSGIAGYFQGGQGVRIDNAGGNPFLQSSVGDMFACISSLTAGAPTSNCDAVCQSRGLTCKSPLGNSVVSGTSAWVAAGQCSVTCTGLGGLGYYACWCG